jgi:TP901 family phage tail tape measure protein
MSTISIGTLFGTLELEDKLSPALKKAGDGLMSTGDKLDNMGKKFTQTGAAMLPLTAGIVALGAGSLKLAIDFESSFAGVRKTVDGVNDEFGNLTDVGKQVQKGIEDLALEIPATTEELARMAEMAGTLGIKSPEIIGFTKVVAGLGEATELTGEEAATMLAQFVNVTGTVKSTENFSKLGSVIVALGNAGASSEKDIAAFGGRIAAAGSIGKFTEAHILAVGSAMASVGIEAEAGGTATQKVMFAMTKSVELGDKHLATFAKTAGMSAAEFQKVFKADPGKAFAEFVQGLGKQGIQAVSTLKELEMRDSRLATAFLSLGKAGGELSRQMGVATLAMKENVAITTETDARYQTTEAQLVMLKNEVFALGRELGRALLPVLRDVMSGFRDFIPYIKGAVDWFKDLGPTGQKVAIGFAALAAAAGPVLMFLGSMITGVGAVVTAFGGIMSVGGTVLGFFASLTPVGWALAAAVAGIVLAWKNWDTITEFVSKTYNAVKSWMGDKLNAVFNTIKEKIQAVKDWFRGMYDAIVGHSYVPDMIKGIEREMKKLGPGMVEPAKEATKQVKADFKEMNAIMEQFSGREVIERGLQMAMAVEKIGGMTKLTKQEQQQANTAIQQALEKYRALGIEAPAALRELNIVLSDTEQMSKNVYFAMRAITPTIKDVNASTLPLASSMIDLGDAMKAVPWYVFSQQASASVRTIGQEIRENLTGVFQSMPDTIIKSLMGGGNPGQAIGAQLMKGVFSDQMVSQFSGLLSKKLGGTIGGALGSMIPGIGTMLGGMAGQLIGPLLGKVAGMFKNLFGGPSAQELAGRDIVREFESNIRMMLSDTQLLEAGNESWRQTVVGVRDAYIAAGYSAEEGEAAAARLWESSKKGGQESKRVIDEINAVILQGTVPAITSIKDEFSDTQGVAVDSISEIQSKLDSLKEDAIGSGNAGLIQRVTELQDTFTDAAATGVADFSMMANEIAAIKAEIGQPVTIEVVMRQVEEFGDTLSSSGGNSVSSDWQLSGRSWEEAYQDFLRANPNDAHRFPKAIADVHRIDEALSNTPGFAGGTPGLSPVDFGGSTLARLHGRESVVPEGSEAEFAARHGFTESGLIRQFVRTMNEQIETMERRERRFPTQLTRAFAEALRQVPRWAD